MHRAISRHPAISAWSQSAETTLVARIVPSPHHPASFWRDVFCQLRTKWVRAKWLLWSGPAAHSPVSVHPRESAATGSEIKQKIPLPAACR